MADLVPALVRSISHVRGVSHVWYHDGHPSVRVRATLAARDRAFAAVGRALQRADWRGFFGACVSPTAMAPEGGRLVWRRR